MNSIYIPLHNANAMLSERRHLRTKVEKWWQRQGWYIPDCFLEHTRIAAFGRAVATRRYEDALFLNYANASELRPIWMEYTNSAFSSHSPFKRSLLQPIFYEKHGKNGGLVSKKKPLAPIEVNRTKKISDIKIESECSLVEYHHDLHSHFKLGERSIIDFSKFYGQFGGASCYYLAYLSLFIAHAVLFEDYHGGEDSHTLGDLTDKIFYPAYEKLEALFGVPLLLVRMPWHENLRLYIPKDCNDWEHHGVIPEEFFQVSKKK